jgi:hypothetical protein
MFSFWLSLMWELLLYTLSFVCHTSNNHTDSDQRGHTPLLWVLLCIQKNCRECMEGGRCSPAGKGHKFSYNQTCSNSGVHQCNKLVCIWGLGMEQTAEGGHMRDFRLLLWCKREIRWTRKQKCPFEESFDTRQHVTWYIRSGVVFKRIFDLVPIFIKPQLDQLQ